jgi:hypothetical protein
MPIQAGKFDVGAIHRSDNGVRVTLRDPESNQTVYPKTTNDHAYWRQGESKAAQFLDDCQRSLDQHREHWDDLLQHIDNPTAIQLWRGEYDYLSKENRLLVGTHGADQFVLIVRQGVVSTIVYEGWPPRTIPTLQSIRIETAECGHRLHR